MEDLAYTDEGRIEAQGGQSRTLEVGTQKGSLIRLFLSFLYNNDLKISSLPLMNEPFHQDT